LTLALCGWSTIADNLTDYLPASSTLVFSVRVKELMNTPVYQEFRQQPEIAEKYQKFEKELQLNNLTIADIPSELLIFMLQDSSKCAILARTSIPEKVFIEKLNGKFKDNYQIKYTETRIQDRVVYLLDNSQNMMQAANLNKTDTKTVAIAYITPDIVFLADAVNAEPLLALMQTKTVKPAEYPGDDKTLAWLMFQRKDTPAAGAPGSPEQMMMANIPFNRFTLGVKNEDATGKDLALVALFSCNDKNAAAMLAMQIQGVAMFGLSSAFKNSPELGMEISKSLKVSLQEEQVTAKLIITDDLRRKMTEYVRKQNLPPAKPIQVLTAPDDSKKVTAPAVAATVTNNK
jgi:hypothetical protein